MATRIASDGRVGPRRGLPRLRPEDGRSGGALARGRGAAAKDAAGAVARGRWKLWKILGKSWEIMIS